MILRIMERRLDTKDIRTRDHNTKDIRTRDHDTKDNQRQDMTLRIPLFAGQGFEDVMIWKDRGRIQEWKVYPSSPRYLIKAFQFRHFEWTQGVPENTRHAAFFTSYMRLYK